MEASSSPVNAPHPDDPEPDDFFGEGADDAAAAAQAEEAAAADAAAASEPEPDAAGDVAPEPEPVSADSPGVREPEPERSVEAVAKQVEKPTPTPAKAAKSESKARSEREYNVLRELTLDAPTLQKLLEHVQAGGAPPVVYIVLDTVTARNDQHALRQVYTTHRESIGEEPRLVPVSGRNWNVKTIRPKRKVEEALEIV